MLSLNKRRLRRRRIICLPIVPCATFRSTFHPITRCAIIQRVLFRHRRRSNRPARASKSRATRSGLTRQGQRVERHGPRKHP